MVEVKDFLDSLDLLIAWFESHPVIAATLASVVGSVGTAIAHWIVKRTPWQGDDGLLDIIENAWKGKNKGGA